MQSIRTEPTLCRYGRTSAHMCTKVCFSSQTEKKNAEQQRSHSKVSRGDNDTHSPDLDGSWARRWKNKTRSNFDFFHLKFLVRTPAQPSRNMHASKKNFQVYSHCTSFTIGNPKRIWECAFTTSNPCLMRKGSC